MPKEQKHYIYVCVYSIFKCDWRNGIHLNKSEEIFLKLGMFIKFSRRTYLSSDMYKS